jgi:hypothetical protein
MKLKFKETTVSAGVMPQAFETAGEKKVEAAVDSTAVEARINMSAEVAGQGLCPECGKPMERSHANGIAVLTCDTHRIAIPAKDDMPTESTHG